MAYTVHITDATTGETREHVEQGRWDETAEFLWEDGNFACDCNRFLWFERAAGKDPNAADYEGEDQDCGMERYSVVIKVDGEIVYSEDELPSLPVT
ncbi:MAG TPA: hypothetical protein VFX15_03025 [Actinomycetes bacterium]|nr:hypothetical protein [Actinomycetes bacterium]